MVQHFIYFCLYLSGPVRMYGRQLPLLFQNKSRLRASGTTVSAYDSMQEQVCPTHSHATHTVMTPTQLQAVRPWRKSCWMERHPDKMKVRVTEWEMYLMLKLRRASYSFKIVQQSGFMFASSPSFQISKNALPFTILLETFILS